MLTGHYKGSEVRELTKSDTLEIKHEGSQRKRKQRRKERGAKGKTASGPMKEEGEGNSRVAAHPIWQRRSGDGSSDHDGFFGFTTVSYREVTGVKIQHAFEHNLN